MKVEKNRDVFLKNFISHYFKSVKGLGSILLSSSLLVGCGGGGGNNDNNGGNGNAPTPTVTPTPTPEPPTTSVIPSRSSSIALTSGDERLVVVNRENNSVSVIQVKNESGEDTEILQAEITVGDEPRSVVITPDDTKALITNAVDGTVSVIDLSQPIPSVIGEPIEVGTEPRGIAISPNGTYAYVANHTQGTVSVISIMTNQVVNTVNVGGNPMAIAITNDGDAEDSDEYVYVTRFFSEVIDPVNRPDGFNDAKQGKVIYFNVESSLNDMPATFEYNLSPLANAGFAADRRRFCQNTRNALQDTGTVFFNSGADGLGNGAAALKNEVFCPDTSSADISDGGNIANTAQGAYTNNLFAAMIRNNTLYIPNVGASPEPPVKFNVNVQALMSSIDLSNGVDTTINLNDQIKRETQPTSPTESLDRLFGNDIVAIDANLAGDQFLIVSRGGNYVMRAGLDSQGQLDINAPSGVIRFKTGNIPSGVVMSHDGTRAYTNNEVSSSVTSIDLENNQVITQDIASSTPAAPGTQKHRELLGKLVFYTALGTPDTFDTNGDGVFDTEVRDIEPLAFRDKASDNAWSSCASCHEDGHSDNVTWIFPTGPRQTIPLEGTFAKNNTDDQRILNWNGVRGSVTDFNNNSRGVQGGTGFATNVNGSNRTTEVFNHGPTKGISDALDAMTEWVANAVRIPIMPDISNTAALTSGRATFENYCASCHGGEKWTKSTISAYENNPTFAENPLGNNFFNGVLALDPNLTTAGPQIRSVEINGDTTNFLDDVGTLFAANDLEIRGAGAIAGQSTQGFNSLGGIGFNTPSLFGIALSSPYLHDGSAVTLEDVFALHTLPQQGNATIDDTINDPIVLQYLAEFVLAIDEQTPVIEISTQ
ncbi:beta-propeller fold lactonase family protein [Agarilytica rhodophyticola]|uniref:beta-propeller fold lactonase family protein n=1 Tax=Agarilytica rhodophyticola TaxID=1737490 RepID=UPI000CD9F7BF|nr:beta-propeller fold lactonase family protein [Agarilytica rhodophyticola]